MFSGRSRSLENFWYEDSAVSNNLALIKDIFSLNFMSRNNNAKGNKNSEYLIEPSFTEKLSSLHRKFFSLSVSS